MAIGVSDLSKNTLGSLQFRQDSQLVQEQIKQTEQKNAKVVQESADSNLSQFDQRSKQVAEEPAAEVTVDEALVNKTSQNMAQLNMQLSFKLSDSGKQNVVLVLDKATGDVVRQIPSEEFVKMSERIGELVNELGDLKGTLVNNKV